MLRKTQAPEHTGTFQGYPPAASCRIRPKQSPRVSPLVRLPAGYRCKDSLTPSVILAVGPLRPAGYPRFPSHANGGNKEVPIC